MLTAIGGGYYRVYRDGVEYSKHIQEREAIESAYQCAADYPCARVTYRHEYEVLVAKVPVARTFERDAEGDGYCYSRPPDDGVGPSAPVLSAAPNDDDAVLNWSPALDELSGILDYQIERSAVSPESFSLLATVASTVTTYTDTVGNSVSWKYRVRGRDNAPTPNNGTYSNTVTVTTPPSAAQLEPGQLAIEDTSYAVAEGAATTIRVRRSGNGSASPTVTVNYAIADVNDSVSPAGGTFTWTGTESGLKTQVITAGDIDITRTGTLTLSSPSAASGSVTPTLGRSSVPFQVQAPVTGGLVQGATISFTSSAGIGTHDLAITTLGLGDGVIENGVLGTQLTTFTHSSGRQWQRENLSQDIQFNNDLGIKCLRDNGSGSGSHTGSFQLDWGANIPHRTPIFFSRWTYPIIDGLDPNAGSATQWKHFRFHPYPWDPPDSGNFWYLTDSPTGSRRRIVVWNQTNTLSFNGYCPSPTDARWHRIDVAFDSGNIDTANGSLYCNQCIPSASTYYPWRIFGPSSSGLTSVNRTYIFSSFQHQYFRYFHVQDYRQYGLLNPRLYHGDYYVQVGTYKHILIGNASTLTACTHTELQFPLSWSNLSGSFRLHRGRLSSFDNLHVFVVDVIAGVATVLAKGPLSGTSITLS